MRRRTLAAALLPILLLAASACSSGDEPAANASGSGAKGADKVTLMLNWYPYGEHAPIYYGVKHGIFAKHGIDLNIQAGQGSGATVQAVGAGNADFGWADTPALLAGVEKGIPIKSLGVYLQTTPASVQFFSAKGYTSPADLKGKTIAGTAGDALSKTFPMFLARNGLKLSDVKIQNTAPASKISAVISGQVDALLGNANDQGPTIAKKTGKGTSAMKFADFGLTYYSNGLIASDSELSKTDLVDRMVKAMSESWTEAAKDPKAAVDSMAGTSQQLPAPEVLRKQFDATLQLLHTKDSTSLPPGANTAADWNATVQTAKEAGLISTAKPVSDYWDDSVALKG
ncbi:ABC transporter substrate-binding protein [Streptomyces sp. HYC2]|uniref:ABC transporter substrate-binding protein n=1 Tax=Streptomyces sp. HYC2 TaxID=2955207 RepID=UPI0024801DCB|nr:ABC transporter substrate-binding protein [Streptomyces sp. HYC2]